MLVADFGGGTSDFSIMRFDPAGGRLRAVALSHAGVGIAGDTFDFRIVDHLISSRLGKGSRYRSFDKLLPLPAHYYADFAQWHRLSLLKSPETMTELRRLVKQAEKPEHIKDLIQVIEFDLGYELYLAVAKLKMQLSASDRASLHFGAMGFNIEAEITRGDFERWIAADIAAIAATVDLALERAVMPPSGVDAVFMTGGSSYVPAVRNLFAARFGRDKLHYGDAFNSVASGLALIAADHAREA